MTMNHTFTNDRSSKDGIYDHIERGLNEIVYVPISSFTYPLLLQQVYKYIHLPDTLLKIYVPRSLDTLEGHWTQEWRRRD